MNKKNPLPISEITEDNWSTVQRALCNHYGVKFVPCVPSLKVGISRETTSHRIPLNGLRHSPAGDTSGWYLWSGEELSTANDFFQPLHAGHLIKRCPEVIRFLGLPPGYRFLVAGEYVDVWYDESLLTT